MKYKRVPVSSTFFVLVPENLTPDEEANYIASRVAFVNLEQLEAEIQEDLKRWEEGKMVSMEETLAELAQETNNDGKNE